MNVGGTGSTKCREDSVVFDEATMRYLLALAIFFAVGCGLVKDGSADRRDLMKEVHVDLSLEDTLVDYRIGDTLWVNVGLFNPQDTAQSIPFVPVGFVLWGRLFEPNDDGEFGFRGVLPITQSELLHLEPGRDTVLMIGFLPITKMVPAAVELKLELAFKWSDRDSNIGKYYYGFSSNTVKVSISSKTASPPH